MSNLGEPGDPFEQWEQQFGASHLPEPPQARQPASFLHDDQTCTDEGRYYEHRFGRIIYTPQELHAIRNRLIAAGATFALGMAAVYSFHKGWPQETWDALQDYLH